MRFSRFRGAGAGNGTRRFGERGNREGRGKGVDKAERVTSASSKLPCPVAGNTETPTSQHVTLTACCGGTSALSSNVIRIRLIRAMCAIRVPWFSVLSAPFAVMLACAYPKSIGLEACMER